MFNLPSKWLNCFLVCVGNGIQVYLGIHCTCSSCFSAKGTRLADTSGDEEDDGSDIGMLPFYYS